MSYSEKKNTTKFCKILKKKGSLKLTDRHLFHSLNNDSHHEILVQTILFLRNKIIKYDYSIGGILVDCVHCNGAAYTR